MIEFKRAGDVMVFECPAFKIEVLADYERIAIGEEASSHPDAKDIVSDAFEILYMMIELKNKRDGNNKVTEMNLKINVDTADAEKTIEQLNHYIWKSELGGNPPGHRFREYMKRRGL